MTTTYLFSTTDGRYIINDERSKLGYGYPRIFVENERTAEYANVDLSLPAIFGMTKENFESWLDGSEITDADFDELCANLAINNEAVLNLVAELQRWEA